MTPLRIVALDPIDGKVRWRHPMIFQPQGTSPTPIVVGDRLIASTQAHGAVAVRIEEKDEKIDPSQSWQMKDARGRRRAGPEVDAAAAEASRGAGLVPCHGPQRRRLVRAARVSRAAGAVSPARHGRRWIAQSRRSGSETVESRMFTRKRRTPFCRSPLFPKSQVAPLSVCG
jgi:hypothetical protein